MSSSNTNSQGTLVKLLNAVALLMVLGCIFFLSSTNERQSVSVEDRLSQFGLVEEDVTIPTTKNTKKRVLSKGKGSYYEDHYYYYTDCVPLYPTPAPTKGKGKGYYRQLDTESNNKERKLSKGSKGSDYSAAPVSWHIVWDYGRNTSRRFAQLSFCSSRRSRFTAPTLPPWHPPFQPFLPRLLLRQALLLFHRRLRVMAKERARVHRYSMLVV